MEGCKEIDRIGNFQGRIVEYGLKKAAESEAVAVALTVHLLTMWDTDQEAWVEWDIYLMVAMGDTWIIKKDGTLNNRACESLVRCAGWDGTLESIADKTWQPTDCQVKVGADTYKNVTRYRIEFLNPYNSIPGKFEELAADKVQNLAQRFGSQLRAIAGTNRANAAPAPAGKPAAPPKPVAKMPPPIGSSVGIPHGGTPPDDETPF